MDISYQSADGHSTLTNLSEAQVREVFERLTSEGYRAFAGNTLQDAEGPVEKISEVPDGTSEIFFIAPLAGG